MDQFEEKKWFVFLGDHHEGPFSMAEMLSKMDQKLITSSSFVWAEGMTDWRLMKEIPAFESVEKKAETPQLGEAKTEKASVSKTREEKNGPSGALDQGALKVVSLPLDMTPLKKAEPPINTAEVEKSWRRRRLIRRTIKTAAVLIVVGGAGAAYQTGLLNSYIDTAKVSEKVQDVSSTLYTALMERARPQMLHLAEKYPVLSKVISPIPHLKDVSAEDYERLRVAASEHLDKGPSVALAQSTEDPARPVFYVSTNLPDGAKFDVYLEGKSDTLVGKIHSSAKVSVTVQKNLGKTDPLVLPQNALIPMGEYQVFATESDAQPEPVASMLKALPPLNAAKTDRLPAGLKLLARKTYFLGGAKDEAYNQKLREFHNQLQQKARIEIADLKDLGSILEKQIQSTLQQFKAIHGKGRGVNTAKKKAWSNFHAEWMKNEIAWLDRFTKLTPDALRDDYVFAEQYDLARQAGQELQKLHDLQNDYFENRLDERGLDIQLGTAKSVVESAFLTFKTKTEQADKAAANPTGGAT
jgi:hypothetical protein